jgi:hypothetical protein
MSDAKDRMKVRRMPMTKAERAQKRAEKELAEEPPSPLDQLLKKLGREPTFEQRLKEVLKSALDAYEKLPAPENHEKGETKDGQ